MAFVPKARLEQSGADGTVMLGVSGGDAMATRHLSKCAPGRHSNPEGQRYVELKRERRNGGK